MYRIADIKREYYRKTRKEQETVEFFSCLLEGLNIAQAIENTDFVHPNNVFVDGGIMYVYD